MSLNPSKEFFSFLVSKVVNGVLVKPIQAIKPIKVWQQQNFEKYYSDANTKFIPNQNSGTKVNIEVLWWEWLTVLSLDAPLVAVLWQMLLADSFQVSLRPLHSLLLFATVWLIYVADRCFDSLVIREAHTTRHAFYGRHLKAVVVLMSFIVAIVLFSAVSWLEPTIFLHGCMLSGVVLLYLANLHLPKKPFLLIPKELQIGLVFAVGSTLTLWSQIHSSQSILLLITSICFASICFLNCSFISLWEKSVDILHKQPSLAQNRITTNKLSNLLQLATVSLVVLCAISPFSFDLKIAFILSSLGLWGLQITQANTSVNLKRVLADVVLMSPLVVLILF